MKRIKNYLFAGLAVTLPLFATFYIIFILLKFTDGLLGRYANDFLERHYGFEIPGIGIIILFISILAAGILLTHVLGRRWVLFLEKLLKKIPFVAQIYPSVKELSNFLFDSAAKGAYKKAALVEFPFEDTYTVGFITNENLSIFKEPAQKDLVSIFIPFVLSPFSGLIILAPKERIKILDMSVEEAMKWAISGGVITPPKLR